MIFVKAKDIVDLRNQLRSIFPKAPWEIKSDSYHDNLCKAEPGASGGIIFVDKKDINVVDEVTVTECAGAITIYISKKIKDRQIHIKYV